MSRSRSSRDNPPPTVAAGTVREFGQTAPARAPSETVRCALCGAHFVADRDGWRAHVVVFGHQPRTGEERGDENAPEGGGAP